MEAKVLIYDALHPDGIGMLRADGLQVGTQADNSAGLIGGIRDYNALVVRRTEVTREILEAGRQGEGKLELVVRAGSGYDNIDVNAATEFGIYVMNAPNGNAVSAAEHTMRLMLLLPSHALKATFSLRSKGYWIGKQKLIGDALDGKTLGIIGCGNVGQ